MIEEFRQLQHAIHERAIVVGRFLQQYKHFACQFVQVPSAAPNILKFSNGNEPILSLGLNGSGPVAVLVPVPLFELGTQEDIENWVSRENKRYAEMHDEMLIKEKKERDMAQLRELMNLYPDEADMVRTGK